MKTSSLIFLLCCGSLSSVSWAQEQTSESEFKTLSIPFRFNGDFRFRTEKIQEEQPDPLKDSDLIRQRMRLRIGGMIEINSNTDVGVRLSTESALGNEPNTTNQDLSGYYEKKNVVLDLAYFDWKPTDNLSVAGGKTPMPFAFVTDNDLIFDSDLTPEGLSAKYQNTIDMAHEIVAVASGTWLNERYSANGTTENTDVGLLAAQLGYAFKGAHFGVRGVASYLNFANIKGDTPPAAKGNTLDAGAYAHSYEVSSLGLEIFSELGDKPVSLFAEYAKNARVSDNNTAAIYGVQYGQLKEPSSWSISIDYREVEADSVIGILTDSDSSGGGTDVRSLRTVIGYQVGKNASLALAHFNGQRAISSTVFTPDYRRTMLDFNFEF